MDRWIHESARIGPGTELGYGVVMEEGVEVGRDCLIGHNVVIRRDTKIGDGVRIDDGAVLGKFPSKGAISVLKPDPDLPPLEVGEGCIIGACAVIYRGAVLEPRVFVADLATVREHTTVGEGTIVGRGVTVENGCRVGRFCKLETECYITAYSVLEDWVFVAPQVTTTNDKFLGRTKERFQHFRGVTVRRGGRIGAGAVVLPGIEIGEDALVAAGAVVTKDVPPRKVVKGVPAAVWKDVPEEQLLENQGWERR